MAQKFHIEYVDDIDGTPLGDSGETIEFSIGGKDYTIDLGEENAAAFHAALEPYVTNGSRVTGGRKRSGRRSTSTRTGATDTKKVREWARENGHEVSDRGRIPAEIMEAYVAAGN